MNTLEQTILRQILANMGFTERVVPYIKDEYFLSNEAAAIYNVIHDFYEEFRQLPSFVAIRLALDKLPELTDANLQLAVANVDELESLVPLDNTQTEYLVKECEKWCQDRALYCALRRSVSILDESNQGKELPHIIPDLVKDALAVSFDTHIGHNFFDDVEARYDFYHNVENKLPFDLDVFNEMTKGGVPPKTLNVVMAGTNVGKSHFLVHQAASYVRMGKKVLYITCEMAEERIAERIDANMLDVPIDDLIGMSKERYISRIQNLRKTSTGQLIIKEYPTGGAHVGHFRILLRELRLKQNFIPDVIFIDYLTICMSSKIKMGSNINGFTYYKAVAEEFRGLAVEYQVPLWTAAQFNRDGFKSSDPGLGETGESFGIPQTADFMIALTITEELEKANQVQAYVLKNRYAKRQTYLKFILGSDTSRMKFYEPQEPVQTQTNSAAPSQAFDAGKPSGMNFKPGFGKRNPRPLSHLKTSEE